jgi:hypothetical protein
MPQHGQRVGLRQMLMEHFVRRLSVVVVVQFYMTIMEDSFFDLAIFPCSYGA